MTSECTFQPPFSTSMFSLSCRNQGSVARVLPYAPPPSVLGPRTSFRTLGAVPLPFHMIIWGFLTRTRMFGALPLTICLSFLPQKRKTAFPLLILWAGGGSVKPTPPGEVPNFPPPLPLYFSGLPPPLVRRVLPCLRISLLSLIGSPLPFPSSLILLVLIGASVFLPNNKICISELKSILQNFCLFVNHALWPIRSSRILSN